MVPGNRPFPPAWTQKGMGPLLVDINKEKQRINPSFLASALLSGAIIISSVLTYCVARRYITHLSNQWGVCPAEIGSNKPGENGANGDPTRPSSQDRAKDTTGLIVAQMYRSIDELDTSILPSQKSRLKNQIAQLRDAQAAACRIGVYFYSNRNAALTVSTAAGILALSSLAFVSKKGWEGTNNGVISIGITSGLVLFSTWTFSQLYGQALNYENQRTKVILSTNLLNAIASATANRSTPGESIGKGAPGADQQNSLALVSAENMAILIRSIDQQLEIINDLKFEGDSSFAEASARRIGDILNRNSLTKPDRN